MISQVRLQRFRMRDFRIVQKHMHHFTGKRLAERVEECRDSLRHRLFRLRYHHLTRRGRDGTKERGRRMMARSGHLFLLTAQEPGGAHRLIRPAIGLVFEDDRRIRA